MYMISSCVWIVTAVNQEKFSYPTIMNPPRWSWDKLGHMAFAHSGQAETYNATDLLLLSKFPMVQFDKKENIASMPGVGAEDRFIAAARLVRAHNDGVKILMYLNGLIDFESFYRLHNATAKTPSLLLRNNKGELLRIRGSPVFDVRQPAMRKVFLDAALYGMRSGAFDGVFIDRANWAQQCGGGAWDNDTCETLVVGQRELLVEITAALGEGNITLAKEHAGVDAMDWQVVNAAMTSDSFCSSYCRPPHCTNHTDPASIWSHPGDAQRCADSIATIANMSARGQLTQSHAMGPMSGSLSDEQREFTMAAFLIGAGRLSYFSYADWQHDCWTLAGLRWWPEFDHPLGEPTSPPNTRVPGKRWKYWRNFSSGTTVYVDVATHIAEIRWGHRIAADVDKK